MRSRRNFLRDCALVAAVTTAAPWRLLEGEPNFSLALFSPQIGHSFKTGGLELKLIEATASPQPGNQGGWESFTLVFRGPRTHPLPESTHWFSHAELGGFALFIAPIPAPDPRFQHYAAVFNVPAHQQA